MKRGQSLSRVALLVLLAAPGCATITGGASDQKVKIDSTPPGAAVVVDGKPCGATPTTVALCRKEGHQVLLMAPGYETAQVTLRRTVNPWLFGNLLVGGLVGVVVDVCTDAAYQVTPGTVHVTLRCQGAPLSPVAAVAPAQGPANR